MRRPRSNNGYGPSGAPRLLGTAWALGVAAPVVAVAVLGGTAASAHGGTSAAAASVARGHCHYRPVGALLQPGGYYRLAFVYAPLGTRLAVYGPGGITQAGPTRTTPTAWQYSSGAYAITRGGFVRCVAG
jgi:hypothetical protein